jgi:hypothetical protein
MAITACTSVNEYKIYSGDTPTIHPYINSYEYSESASGTTIIPSVQCRSVRIGGAGLNS